MEANIFCWNREVMLFDFTRKKEETLYSMIKEGKIYVLKHLFKQSRMVQEDMDRALCYAAIEGKVCVTKYLLKRGANAGVHKNYPLNQATYYGHKAVARLLLSSHYYEDDDLDFCMLLAVMGGHIEMVKFFQTFGVEVKENEELLTVAVERGDKPMVEYLIKQGVNLDSIMNDKNAPVARAAESGSLDMVKYLVETHGANAFERDGLPLVKACSSGHLDIAKYLIDEKGGNPDGLLRFAIDSGSTGIVEYLVEHCGNKITKDIFISAVEMGHTKVVTYFISKGKEVKIDYCLHICVMAGYYELVKLFVEKCEVDLTRGGSKMLITSSCRHQDVSKYLIKNGVDPTVEGYSLFRQALRKKQWNFFLFLMSLFEFTLEYDYQQDESYVGFMKFLICFMKSEAEPEAYKSLCSDYLYDGNVAMVICLYV